MPVIFLKYHPDLVSDREMAMLVAALPKIVSGALDVPEDPNKRLGPKDIQVWCFPPEKFDVNLRALQLMIPVHGYPERVANLEERKNTINSAIRDVLGPDSGADIGWTWVLPSSDTAFGRI